MALKLLSSARPLVTGKIGASQLELATAGLVVHSLILQPKVGQNRASEKREARSGPRAGQLHKRLRPVPGPSCIRTPFQLGRGRGRNLAPVCLAPLSALRALLGRTRLNSTPLNSTQFECHLLGFGAARIRLVPAWLIKQTNTICASLASRPAPAPAAAGCFRDPSNALFRPAPSAGILRSRRRPAHNQRPPFRAPQPVHPIH